MILAALFVIALSGVADHLHDGDSFHLQGQRVRLAQIDAPEIDQVCLDAADKPYAAGVKARDYLVSLIHDDPISCTAERDDRYGRPLVTCRTGDSSLSINQRMVRAGWAFAAYGDAYRKDQLYAQSQRLGVWRGPCQVPAEWRKAHRP